MLWIRTIFLSNLGMSSSECVGVCCSHICYSGDFWACRIPVFFFVEGEGSVSINNLLQFYMDWPSQALASSIPFKSAYYFNFIQLLLVVCLIVNDLRSYKVSTKEALYAHSQCNEDIVIGNFLVNF